MASSRRVLILIGGPSGSGKTTLSEAINRGLGMAIPNFDFKRLPATWPDVCIVEISTNKWQSMMATRNWHALMDQLPSYEHVITVGIRISRRDAAKQYAARLIEWREIKPRPWLHALRYLVTNSIERSELHWRAFECGLAGRTTARHWIGMPL